LPAVTAFFHTESAVFKVQLAPSWPPQSSRRPLRGDRSNSPSNRRPTPPERVDFLMCFSAASPDRSPAQTLFGIQSHDRQTLINNTTALARPPGLQTACHWRSPPPPLPVRSPSRDRRRVPRRAGH
jgi:hypothetical protein